MTKPVPGERVTLVHLLHEGEFPGVVLDYGILGNACTVKLDCQDAPVHGVLYYEQRPTEICSSQWQACWPRECDD